MEKPIEAVMKQLAVKPRQTVNEIVTATGLSKDEVIFTLISLASRTERWWPLQRTASRVTDPTSFRSDTLGGWDTPHGELLHPSSDLCIVNCHHHGAGRSNRIAVPAGGAASEVTPPQVVVSATYPGASAEVVANTVTTPLEQQINGVPGRSTCPRSAPMTAARQSRSRSRSVIRSISPRSTCRTASPRRRAIAGDRQSGGQAPSTCRVGLPGRRRWQCALGIYDQSVLGFRPRPRCLGPGRRCWAAVT